MMWDRDYAASVSVAEWWEDNCGGAPELQEFSSATSQHGINSFGVERVNSAIKNVRHRQQARQNGGAEANQGQQDLLQQQMLQEGVQSESGDKL